MAIILNRFDGGEVDFLSARDLKDNQFQVFKNMSAARITRAVKRLGLLARTGQTPEATQPVPGSGFFAYRTEWDNTGTAINVSTLWRVFVGFAVGIGPASSFVTFHRNNTLQDNTGSWEPIFGYAPTQPWTLRTANANLTFTASTKRISGDANLEQFEPGDILRVHGTVENDGYYTVIAKAPAASSVGVLEDFTDEVSVGGAVAVIPIISFYAVGGNLRISNGIFQDTAPSQWFGYIKRDFWGQGVTYGSDGGRFSQPPMKEAYNNWKLQDQELVAPIVGRGTRVGDATGAANQVAIHIAGTHPADWPDKATDVEWNSRDRVTVSFVYDFVQESELGRTVSGEIGIPMGTIASSGDARAFMVEAYTGAANASWNRRITAIRLYYKFHDDPDWYEVSTLDVNKGWSESELIFDTENTGYWQPIITSKKGSGTTDGAGGSGTTINDAGHGVSQGEGVYLLNTATIEPGSLFTKAASVAANTITLPVAAVDSLGVNPANYNALDYIYGVISTTAVATFYIPFTGEKAYTYDTNTGRAAKLKVPATRWRTADTDGSKVLIGNVDTLDDNAQTSRERSRVYESPDGMPDTFILSKSKDLGIHQGDQVLAIKYFNRAWWVMMERNVVVLQPGTLVELHRFDKVGCKWGNAFVSTKHGLAIADESQITLLPSGDEISFPKRDSYQSLSFFNPSLGYSINQDELYFIPRSGLDGTEMWVYSFRTSGWRRVDIPTNSNGIAFTNLISNSLHNEPEVVYITMGDWKAIAYQLNSGTDSNTGEIKTKDYHNGTPYLNKQFRNGYLSYRSSSQEVLVEVYLDGNALPAKPIHLDASSSMINAQVPLNVTAKLVAFNFKSPATDFEIEEFVVAEKEITASDR